MPRVELTAHLRRFFPTLEVETRVEGDTAAEVVAALEARHPGLAHYLVDEQGALRRHVNIFVGEAPVVDRMGLSDLVDENERVFIFLALSGG